MHVFIHSYYRAVLGCSFVIGLAKKMYKILHTLSNVMKTVQLLKSEEFEIGTTDTNGYKLRQSDFVVTQDDFEGISICQILYNSIY